MKRLLTFNFTNNKYIICENDTVIFEIDGYDLKFNSEDFYNGLYANKQNVQIELKNIISNDDLKKGNYIYQWINEIITSINEEFIDNEVEDENIKVQPSKIIRLYDMAACAGDGLFLDNEDVSWTDYSTNNLNADFAIKIVGKSMEPLINDGSIVLVQQTETLENGDIGIFNINGEAMCKKYYCRESETILIPNNREFQDVKITSDTVLAIQGKVLMNHE